jgi:hypothetical protein
VRIWLLETQVERLAQSFGLPKEVAHHMLTVDHLLLLLFADACSAMLLVTVLYALARRACRNALATKTGTLRSMIAFGRIPRRIALGCSPGNRAMRLSSNGS